jgi:hypothetical protein
LSTHFPVSGKIDFPEKSSKNGNPIVSFDKEAAPLLPDSEEAAIE